MTKITPELLKFIMPQAAVSDLKAFADPLEEQMTKYGIISDLSRQHFLAQIGHESGSLRYTEENLNYSVIGLMKVFSRYFPNEQTAIPYARQPEKIANRVYANRMGNGNESSGDGWRYRGRGLIQLTGKENYQRFFNAQADEALINDPDLIAEDPNFAVEAACWFWASRELNKHAENDDLKAVTLRVNGGHNGLNDRERYLERAKTAFAQANDEWVHAGWLEIKQIAEATSTLRIRSSGEKLPNNEIGLLKRGEKVEVYGVPNEQNYIKIKRIES